VLFERLLVWFVELITHKACLLLLACRGFERELSSLRMPDRRTGVCPTYRIWFKLEQIVREILAASGFGKEVGQLVEGDKFHPVVEIDVAGVRNDEQFLWLTGKAVSLFTKLPGMRGITRDEKHRTR
jgi:hypothetical protein